VNRIAHKVALILGSLTEAVWLHCLYNVGWKLLKGEVVAYFKTFRYLTWGSLLVHEQISQYGLSSGRN
jgi:hypothetical protein